MPDTQDAKHKEFEGWEIKELWVKYEDIAMHFNDLLIRLRTQALAGVAAISTLVGIFTKTDVIGVQASWEVAAFIFFGLALFWIAIWIVDFFYYNKLLLGAVAAIINLEKQSETASHTRAILLSTTIEHAVAGSWTDHRDRKARRRLRFGVLTFYSIVLVAITLGFSFSLFMYFSTLPTHSVLQDYYERTLVE